MTRAIDSLLRDILIEVDWSQRQLADALDVSPALVSYWYGSNSATAIHIGSILSVVPLPPERALRLIKKHLQ